MIAYSSRYFQFFNVLLPSIGFLRRFLFLLLGLFMIHLKLLIYLIVFCLIIVEICTFESFVFFFSDHYVLIIVSVPIVKLIIVIVSAVVLVSCLSIFSFLSQTSFHNLFGTC